MRLGTKVTWVVALAIVALAVIFFANNVAGTTNGASGTSGSSAYPYQVGSPGRGADALPIQLPSTSGGTFDLSTQANKTVLLFFMEGVGCEPCWTQIKAIEKHWSQFRSLGIDEMVTITTNTIPQLKQKVADEKIHTPVLSDPNFDVSHAYNTNKYGMMGDQMDGHTFILVGKGGLIRWRADYGGQTMAAHLSTSCIFRCPRSSTISGRGFMGTRPELVEVVVLTQKQCAFCDQAKEILCRLAVEYPLSVSTLDVSTIDGQAMAERNGILFPPGILLDREAFSYGRPSEKKLRRELDRRLGLVAKSTP